MNTHTEDRGIVPDEVPIGVTLPRTCVGCGTEYEWTSREGFRWPTSYCTRRCKRKSAANRLIKLDADAPEVAGEMRLLVCPRCEEPFGWVPRQGASGRLTPPTYCSPTCGDAVREKRRKRRKAEADAARAERRAQQEAAVAAKRERQAERAAREGRIEEADRLRRELDHQRREMAHRRWLAEQQPQQQDTAEDDLIAVAISAAARELLLTGGRCVTCGKVASPTREAAKETKRAIEQRAGRTKEVRYYQCPDGWWHWTRMNVWGAPAEHLMTESPASLRHQGRGTWRALGEVR